MDIKKLIDDGYVAIQGFRHAEWVRKDADYLGMNTSTPNYTGKAKGPTQKRMFGVAFNQPVGNEYLVTTIIFDMSSCYGFRWMRKEDLLDPWEKRRHINKETAQIVPDDEAEEIRNNPVFKALIRDWAEEKAEDALRKLSRLSFATNNRIVQDREDTKARRAAQKKLDDYALSLDPEENYGWESEWTHTNYDPYNGSGDCTLDQVARDEGCKNEADIDDLFRRLNNGARIDTYGDRTHTWYWKKNPAKKAYESKKFMVKNYKGNVTESLRKFNKTNPDLKVKNVYESEGNLIIEAVSEENKDKYDSYRADFDGAVDRFNKAIHDKASKSSDLLKIAKELVSHLEKMSGLDK